MMTAWRREFNHKQNTMKTDNERKQLSPHIIETTNDWVRGAICAVRIERNPVTMSMLYDAITKRRNARDYEMPEWMRRAYEYETERDISGYGRIERNAQELYAAVLAHKAIN
jgi:hypothetical protein